MYIPFEQHLLGAFKARGTVVCSCTVPDLITDAFHTLAQVSTGMCSFQLCI